MQHDLYPGMIAPWSGAIVDIPSDWSLCDGNNGTPDLRNRFIVGAGDTYTVDDQGGATPHDHPFTGDGHDHQYIGGFEILDGANLNNVTNTTQITGTTDTDPGLPKYYALAYIMYTG